MLVSPPPMAFLYEDDALVVVDKPAGVPVAAAPGWPAEACVQARAAAAVGSRLWLVHRLDRETSGALAFARTAAAHRALSQAFERREVTKTYHALVAGIPVPPRGAIELPLHEARKGKTRPAVPGETGAKPAQTGYQVRRAWWHDAAAVALVEARPATGRHHQIRVHLRAIGVPILADAVYGRGVRPLPADHSCPRLALHADALDLPHPDGRRRVVVAAPWPADLAGVTAWLDAHWRVETPA
jgi:tRNA pseudouridine32 synthase/23S rRNA pseudouridine746 synthase